MKTEAHFTDSYATKADAGISGPQYSHSQTPLETEKLKQNTPTPTPRHVEIGEQQTQTHTQEETPAVAHRDGQFGHVKGELATTHRDVEFGKPVVDIGGVEHRYTPVDTCIDQILTHTPVDTCVVNAHTPIGVVEHTPTLERDAGQTHAPEPETATTYLDVVGQHDLLCTYARVNGTTADVLIDGGSTHDLMSFNFAKRAGIPLLKACGQITITLADGSKTTTPRQKTEHNVAYRIDSFSDSRRFLIAPTAHDIVLGKPWLTRHNPSIDWETNTIILRDGVRIIANEHRKGEVTIETISASQFKRMINKGQEIQVYKIDIHAIEGESEGVAEGKQEGFTLKLDHLSVEDARKLKHTLKKYEHTVFKEPTGLPPSRTVDHKIEIIPGNTPPSRSPYKISQPELEELRKQLANLLDQGWIRPSISPYGAPILFVKKKNGSLRMCVDYRALNRITVKNKYPLPHIGELLDRLSGAKYFTKLDLRSGYHQLRIADTDIHKTAFNTRYGHFEFTVVPFELCNAPASFQGLMNDTLRPYLDQFVIVYLDDILIYSKSFKEHVQHIRTVFDTLEKNELHVALEKCQFAVSEIEYLGCYVSHHGVRTDESKIAAIRDWPEPKSITDVQMFMGLANYFHKHIPHFAHIATPLTDLLRGDVKNKEFRLSEEAREAFDILKRKLTSTPVLALPDFSKKFRVTTDASKYAMGMLLSQIDDNGKERPIAFESRKFRDYEKNWATPDKELSGIVHALNIWRHYLDGQKVTVFTDHEALKYIQQQPKLNQRQARWLQHIQSYDLNIQHMPGRLNLVADALSRRPDLAEDIENIVVSELTAVQLSISDSLTNQIKEGYKIDKYFNELVTSLNNTLNRSTNKFKIIEGLIYLTDNNRHRLCIPDIGNIRLKLLEENHDIPIAGHRGFEKTYNTVARHYWWPNMGKLVKHFVQSCDYCQRAKGSNQLAPGALISLDIPQERWEIITMDFILGLPKTKSGYDSILTVVDKLSKRAHFLKTRSTADARDTAHLFINEIFKLHGLPKAIISDRDSKFTSKFWQSIFQRLGTRLQLSTANHPQTDGQTERLNRTLEDMLRCVVNYHQSDWDEKLPLVEFAYNNSVNASTKMTPFNLDTGRDPIVPQDLLTHTQSLESRNEAANQLVQHLKDIMQIARDNLLTAQQRQAKYYNEKHRLVEFQVGDTVLVESSYLLTPQERAREKDKLKFKRSGPYTIIEKISSHAYRLELPSSCRAHNVFNIAALTPYRANTLEGRRVETPPPVITSEGEEWRVIEILAHRTVGRGRQYLTRYEGDRDIDATWQPRRVFVDGNVTNNVLLDYERSHNL